MSNLSNRSAVMQAFSRAQQMLAGLSLQTRFLLIMGISSLFISLLFWVMFNNFTENLLMRTGSRFAREQMLFDKARTLQPMMREMARARQSAEDPLIQQWAANERDAKLYRRSMNELRNRFPNSNFYVAIARSGNFYYCENTKNCSGKLPRLTLDPDSPEDAWIYDFFKSGEERSIKVLSNKKLGVNKIWVMVPIRDGNQVIGVVGTGISLYDFTLNASSIHLPGVTNMFIDRNAHIQIYNDVTHFDFPGVVNFSEAKHLHVRILGETAGDQWLHQTIRSLGNNNQRVETAFVHIDGVRYLAGLNTLPEVGWYDLTLIDLSVLLPKADFMWMVLAVVTGTLGLLSILALSLHTMVLKPVATLTDAVSRMRQGDYSSRKLKKSSGEVQELITQFHDMSEAIFNTQQWLEEEIEKRTRQIKDAKKILEISLKRERDGRETQANLMALMAHEMRSPIAVISNTAQMMDMLAQTDCPTLQPRIGKIMRSVRELATLMDTFLSEKWLDMDKQGLNRMMGDLNQLCMEVVANLVDSHHRTIRFVPLDGEAKFCADWPLVRIAVINLLDNASKYSSSENEICLKILSGETGMLCVEVSDRGVGIPPELQPRIFEKFARGQHEADIQGTGLGLYLVNWIARFHGGHTEVSSTEGQGSTFRLCLPLC
ncbi:MAG: ATP-binding protein [Sideroxydans sp.]|nr:ATP-binding protein [Sideroxydans sp.]